MVEKKGHHQSFLGRLGIWDMGLELAPITPLNPKGFDNSALVGGTHIDSHARRHHERARQHGSMGHQLHSAVQLLGEVRAKRFGTVPVLGWVFVLGLSEFGCRVIRLRHGSFHACC